MTKILTNDDLGEIRQLMVQLINEHIIQIVVENIDQLAQATAAGFEDVQQQIYVLQNDVDELRSHLKYTNDKLDVIERVQQAEVQRADRHDLIFRKMSQALKTI